MGACWGQGLVERIDLTGSEVGEEQSQFWGRADLDLRSRCATAYRRHYGKLDSIP